MAKVTIQNKSSVDIHGVAPGAKAQIEVDEEGTPLDINWRRRMRDAKIDNCIEIVTSKKKKAKEDS